MIIQLTIGTVIIIFNVILQAEMFSAYSRRLEKTIIALRVRFRRFANTAAIVTGVLFVMSVHSIQVWIWAFTFQTVGAFHGRGQHRFLFFSATQNQTIFIMHTQKNWVQPARCRVRSGASSQACA